MTATEDAHPFKKFFIFYPPLNSQVACLQQRQARPTRENYNLFVTGKPRVHDIPLDFYMGAIVTAFAGEPMEIDPHIERN
jgi:hypothetical protein